MHGDVHAGNFLVNEDGDAICVKAIDFDQTTIMETPGENTQKDVSCLIDMFIDRIRIDPTDLGGETKDAVQALNLSLTAIIEKLYQSLKRNPNISSQAKTLIETYEERKRKGPEQKVSVRNNPHS